jgi:hypothetical protein
MSNIKSIRELITEREFFANNNVSVEGTIGFAIGYLMEEIQIPDLTTPNYNPNSKKILVNYVGEINKALVTKKMDNFFNKTRADDAKYIYARHDFMPILQHSLSQFPSKLYNAFGQIIDTEENTERKSELQLMEIVMFSRLPSLCKKQIIDRLERIDVNCIPIKLESTYELARNYFI